MWAEAAKWLRKYNDAVLTALDADGYPVSLRISHEAYDAATGELVADIPEELHAAEGPANLLCHYHDEKMWNISAVQIKGRICQRDGRWVFVSTRFDAPSKLAMLYFIRNARNSGQKYLDKRGLSRPEVDWVAIKEAQRRAAGPR